MARRWLYGGLGGAVLLALAAQWISAVWVASGNVVHEKPLRRVELAPMCPWRDPDADLRAFFPDATGHRTEVRILSGALMELARRLGRRPAAEEYSLYVHRVFHEQQRLGAVLTRRVKGEYGAIELVLAVGADGAVRGARLQRWREPEPIAAVLRDSHWLGAFAGKTARSDWRLGQDIPAVPAEARGSAKAVVQGARSLLILLETAEQQGIVVPPHPATDGGSSPP
jgi:hypothetical protein